MRENLDERSTDQRQAGRQKKSHLEGYLCKFRSAKRSVTGGQTGEGGFDSGGRQRDTKCKDRKNQMIDTDSFCTKRTA